MTTTGPSDGRLLPYLLAAVLADEDADALDHARRHNENATRGNEHDYAVVRMEIECPLDGP